VVRRVVVYELLSLDGVAEVSAEFITGFETGPVVMSGCTGASP